ncbi:MAG: hypothetical protein QXF86_03180 [Candidatus Bilamarchaeaceae archaeon]
MNKETSLVYSIIKENENLYNNFVKNCIDYEFDAEMITDWLADYFYSNIPYGIFEEIVATFLDQVDFYEIVERLLNELKEV